MIDLLADCDDTVMARRAVVTNTQMIKRRPGKVVKFNNVTIRTVPGCRQVIVALSCAYISVVARCAVARDTRVVKDRPRKGACTEVTDLAVLGGRHMVNILGCRNRTVVA